jgi:uncharacterized membrane protein (UPF0127 family)
VRPLVSAAAVLLSAVAAACADSADAPGPTPGPEVRFTRAGNEAVLSVEIADSGEERQQGLMGRASLPEDGGMLFVYEEDTETGFFMRNTTIPLSIAFISAAGCVIDIQDMEPLSEETHSSPEPYRYAVEVNQGWFEEKGVEVGDLVELPVGVGIE